MIGVIVGAVSAGVLLGFFGGFFAGAYMERVRHDETAKGDDQP